MQESTVNQKALSLLGDLRDEVGHLEDEIDDAIPGLVQAKVLMAIDAAVRRLEKASQMLDDAKASVQG